MFVGGPIPQVDDVDLDPLSFDRQLQQALAQVAGKHLREQGQYVQSHRHLGIARKYVLHFYEPTIDGEPRALARG